MLRALQEGDVTRMHPTERIRLTGLLNSLHYNRRAERDWSVPFSELYPRF